MSTTTTTTPEPVMTSAAVGKKYERRYPEAPVAPWLDDLPAWRQALGDNLWTRWDGTVGTAQNHMQWARRQMQAFFDDRQKASEFRRYGSHNGATYYIHDGLTRDGSGYGLFKIDGPVLQNVQPRDVLRLCFDMPQIVELDKTCVFYKLMQAYPLLEEEDASSSTTRTTNQTSLVHPVYWCNDPGWPFFYRNGIDLTGFLPDDNTDSNIIWQLGVGVQVKGFEGAPSTVHATDRYWAYRLAPTTDGSGTQVSIICQCCLNGWIPKFLSNYFVCQVLIDSLSRMQQQVQNWKQDPSYRKHHEKRLQELGLAEW